LQAVNKILTYKLYLYDLLPILWRSFLNMLSYLRYIGDILLSSKNKTKT